MPAKSEFQPGEIHFGIQRLDMNLAVADLHDKHAVIGQVVGGLSEHTAHQIQTILPTSQAERRFMLELSWHVGEV